MLQSQSVVLTSHVTVLLSDSVVPLFFFLTFMIPASHYVVPTSYVIILLSHSVVPLFFLKFDGIILTLHSTNITCDYTFVTFCGFLIFFSHLMVSTTHYAILTPHVTVLLSHSVVPLFFFTFYGIILILHSTNITCDYTFLTFSGSLIFFSHFIVPVS